MEPGARHYTHARTEPGSCHLSHGPSASGKSSVKRPEWTRSRRPAARAIRRCAAPASLKSGSDKRTIPIHALGHPGIGAHGDRGAAALVCGANEVARERTAFLSGGDGAVAGRPGEEPRSVSDTRGGAMSEPMLDAAGRRLRGLIVVLWRAGLRICEALALAEADLDARRGSLLVRRGKGGRRREVGMDDWAWEQLAHWLDVRVELPVGPLVLRRRRRHARAPLGGRRRAFGAA